MDDPFPYEPVDLSLSYESRRHRIHHEHEAGHRGEPTRGVRETHLVEKTLAEVFARNGFATAAFTVRSPAPG
jgi:hypothetical protein